MRTSPTRTTPARTPVLRAALRGLRALAPPVGFYLLTVALLAGVLGLDLAIIGAAGSHSQLVPAEVWGISAIVGCLLLYGLYAVRGANRRPEGLRVSRQQQPRLWRLVEQTAQRVGVRAPHALWLTDDDGLAAWQNPRLLGLLPTHRRLSIGVPLLVGLTEAQLAALLAHRLGPAADADTPLPGLVRRNREALRLVLRRYTDTDHSGPGPRKWFGGMYAGYARSCLRWSAPDVRRLEFAADRAAARVAGRDTTVAALRLAPALSELRQRYWHEFVLIGWEHDAFPPAAEVVPAFQEWLRGPVGQEELARLASDPPRERIARYDARPPLAERIRRLEHLPPTPTEPPAPAAPSAPASPASPAAPASPADLLIADPSPTFAQVVAAAPDVPGKPATALGRPGRHRRPGRAGRRGGRAAHLRGLGAAPPHPGPADHPGRHRRGPLGGARRLDPAHRGRPHRPGGRRPLAQPQHRLPGPARAGPERPGRPGPRPLDGRPPSGPLARPQPGHPGRRPRPGAVRRHLVPTGHRAAATAARRHPGIPAGIPARRRALNQSPAIGPSPGRTPP